MRRIERLRREALEACNWRGHDMERFRYIKQCNVGYANCRICNKQVVIDPYPPPNGIEISGEAVALDCGSPSRFNFDGSVK